MLVWVETLNTQGGKRAIRRRCPALSIEALAPAPRAIAAFPQLVSRPDRAGCVPATGSAAFVVMLQLAADQPPAGPVKLEGLI